MRRSTLIVETVVLILGSIFATVVQAAPGEAPDGTAIAEYDPETGGIVVSVKGVNNWYLYSNTGSFTEASPALLPLSVDGLLTDDDFSIGETNGSIFEYTNVDLGEVALADLLVGDLTMQWNAGIGEPLEQGPVVYLGVGPAGPDYDSDNDVDGQDFLIWQRDDATAGGLTAWETYFGGPPPSAAASLSAVPEPSSLLMVVLGGLALAATRRRG